MTNNPVLIETAIPLPLASRGKVRDTYDLGQRLLIVATDRISAFDVVLPTPIPDKGRVLTLLSTFWFQKTARIMPNHFITLFNKTWFDYSREGRRFLREHDPCGQQDLRHQLAYRAMLVKKARRLPVECVVRGYLAGSAWSEYREHGTVSGIALPRGLEESQELPEPLFTPTTKAETGHDEPLSEAELIGLVGEDTSRAIKEKSLAIYRYARKYASKRGIIIADTKFEFGRVNGELTVIDEMLTPDSSRFWDAKRYQAGRSQPSYDKQPVRDWLAASGWNREPPAPPLPPEVIEATTRRYRHAYKVLTGKKLN